MVEKMRSHEFKKKLFGLANNPATIVIAVLALGIAAIVGITSMAGAEMVGEQSVDERVTDPPWRAS